MALQTKSIPIVVSSGAPVPRSESAFSLVQGALKYETDRLVDDLQLAPDEYSVQIVASALLPRGEQYIAMIGANFIYEIKSLPVPTHEIESWKSMK